MIDMNDILVGGGGLLVLAMTLIQITPIKLNPWTAIAKLLGRAINGDVLDELDNVKCKLEVYIDSSEQRDAEMHRRNILHFNNELIRQKEHTKEEYVEILGEIDAYRRYCDSHPDYQNSGAVHAVAHIERTYDIRLDKGDFLQE